MHLYLLRLLLLDPHVSLDVISAPKLETLGSLSDQGFNCKLVFGISVIQVSSSNPCLQWALLHFRVVEGRRRRFHCRHASPSGRAAPQHCGSRRREANTVDPHSNERREASVASPARHGSGWRGGRRSSCRRPDHCGWICPPPRLEGGGSHHRQLDHHHQLDTADGSAHRRASRGLIPPLPRPLHREWGPMMVEKW
ncbi:hypothetical protein PR202_ga17294 [Eleusine coracana subsp. coracana]|uniref:Uncharacterized protein n=1 Tax=Eleusine coracana subsp. coracana TaxID=191504 RepID=A0AAV5CPM2_ELECO|nr:hypothetical protein PR202_ga17294 [Eleusine coracana subsp. coracana]